MKNVFLTISPDCFKVMSTSRESFEKQNGLHKFIRPMNLFTAKCSLALLFCLPTFLLFSQTTTSPIVFGRDTAVINGDLSSAKKWLDEHPLELKTLQNLPTPNNPGYYAEGQVNIVFQDNFTTTGMANAMMPINVCGNGVAVRTYSISSQGQTVKAEVRYLSENRTAFTVTFPQDITVYLNKATPNVHSPDLTGKPILNYLLPNSAVSFDYTDELICLSPGTALKDIKIRTWKVLNWCQPLDLNDDLGEVRKTGANCAAETNTYTCINVLTADKSTSVFSKKAPHYKVMQALADKENCYQYDTDGYMAKYQKITIMDTIPPTIDSIPAPIVENLAKECKNKVTINSCFATDASGITSISFQLKKKNANIVVLSGSTFPANIDISEADFADYVLTYTVTDMFSNKATKSINFVVKDIKKPTPICYHGLSADLLPATASAIVSSELFNAGSYDNCSTIETFVQVPYYNSTKDITKLKIDSSPNGTTSRDSVNKLAKLAVFNCTGAQTLILWIKDKAGNWDFCETYIEVQNNLNVPNVSFCKDKGTNKISVKIKKENGDPVNGFVNFRFDPNAPPIIPTKFNTPFGSSSVFNTANGEAFNFAETGENRYVAISNDSKPNNGVTTADLVILSKHILGTELIKSKYRLIAADVNSSGKISTADLVEIRKVILGLLGGFSNNPSWKFFSDTTFNQAPYLKNIKKDTLLNFVAVKMGDLNDSAKGLKAGESTGRNEDETAYFDLDEKTFSAGEEIIFSPKNPDIDGYQTTIFYDEKTMQLIDIQENSDNFAVKENGTILASEVFFNNEKRNPSALRFKALQAGKLSQSIRFSDAEIPSETYQNETTKTLKLRFNNLEKSNVELFQNQPNPFLNETKITFFSPKKANATFAVFDLNNRLIHTESMLCEKGENQILFQNSQLSQGIYRYQIEVEGVVRSLKMIKL